MRRQHAQLPRHWHNQPLYSFLSQAAATQQSRSFTTSRAAHGDGVESQIEDLGTRADALEERLSILEGQEGIRTAIHSLALMLDTANQRAKEVITMWVCALRHVSGAGGGCKASSFSCLPEKNFPFLR
jgi:hypothetical protein